MSQTERPAIVIVSSMGDQEAAGVLDQQDGKISQKEDNPSTKTTITDAGDMRRDNSALTTKGVELTVDPSMSSALQSLVTQVQRDDSTRKNGLQRHTSQDEIPPFNLHRDSRPSPNTPPVSPNRSLFSRLLCCLPKGRDNDRQMGVVVPATNSFYLGRKKSSFGSFRNNLSRSQSDLSVDATALALSGQRTTALSAPISSSSSLTGKKLLALDLDETLVHSSFQPVDNASFVISVCIEGVMHSVYVIKRPGVDQFLERMAQHYELIIYTASLAKYADPLLDILDVKRTISRRLFRESCVFYDGHYVKDLSVLDKDISRSIIVDNSPMSYIFHPENAIDCKSFFDDPNDTEMWQIADFLEYIHACDDVRAYCKHWREWCRNNVSSVPAHLQKYR